MIGIFQSELIEVVKYTLNIVGITSRAGTSDYIKRRKLRTCLHFFLLLDCGWNVTSSLLFLPPRLS